MVKARNNNSDCAMCCNPTPTEVYKHLGGFVKLLCKWDKNLTLSFSTSSTGRLTPVKSNTTQLVSPTTAVTSNTQAGVITTFTQTVPSNGFTTFIVNNSTVVATSVINLTIDDLTSTGNAIVKVSTVATGSFIVKIYNAHPTVALNGAVKIHYLVS